jgi:hypothetical protein
MTRPFTPKTIIPEETPALNAGLPTMASPTAPFVQTISLTVDATNARNYARGLRLNPLWSPVRQ